MQWAVSIGKIDITTAVMTLSGFRAAPRVGHLDRAKRAYGYLSKTRYSKIKFDVDQPDYSNLEEPTYEWRSTSVYENISEEIPDNLPIPL